MKGGDYATQCQGQEQGRGSSLLSLDEQIAALEAACSSSSSGNGDSGSESDASSGEAGDNVGAPVPEVDAAGRLVRLVSTLSAERIAPLSPSLLPSASCGARSLKPGQLAYDDRPKAPRVPRAIRFADEDAAAALRADKKGSRKRARVEDVPAVAPEALSADRARSREAAMSGMEATVRELLRSYQPASAERKPFWCRVCQHQSSDEASLLEHRASEFHAVAVRMESKASRCELCRKQFTSPVQLREHLGSKLHKQRLEYVKVGQVQRKKFC